LKSNFAQENLAADIEIASRGLGYRGDAEDPCVPSSQWLVKGDGRFKSNIKISNHENANKQPRQVVLTASSSVQAANTAFVDLPL
jgi:hypothetical protein